MVGGTRSIGLEKMNVSLRSAKSMSVRFIKRVDSVTEVDCTDMKLTFN